MREPKLKHCLDEGKKDYEVSELTKAYNCANDDRVKVKSQLQKLQKDVKAIEDGK